MVYGAAKKVGGEAYIERINREGGIRGRKIVLTTLDDRYDAAEAVKNVRKLDEDGVIAVLGTLGVPAVAAILPVIDQLRLPAVGLTSGAAAARNPVRRYAFPVRASYADEAEAIGNQLATLGLKNIAVFYQNDGFGKSGL